MASKRLGKRQQQILTFIRSFVAERGISPSNREIGDAVGLSSSSTTHSHITALEVKGYIRRDPGKPRSIQLVEQVAPGPSRVQVLEGLLRRGVEFVSGHFAGMTANAGDGLSVGTAQKWVAEVAAVLPEVA